MDMRPLAVVPFDKGTKAHRLKRHRQRAEWLGDIAEDLIACDCREMILKLGKHIRGPGSTRVWSRLAILSLFRWGTVGWTNRLTSTSAAQRIAPGWRRRRPLSSCENNMRSSAKSGQIWRACDALEALMGTAPGRMRKTNINRHVAIVYISCRHVPACHRRSLSRRFARPPPTNCRYPVRAPSRVVCLGRQFATADGNATT